MQPINGFLDQCCLLARNARTAAIDLYLAYVMWCLEEGIPVQDQFTFLDSVACYGLKVRKRKREIWCRGITVLPAYRVGQRYSPLKKGTSIFSGFNNTGKMRPEKKDVPFFNGLLIVALPPQRRQKIRNWELLPRLGHPTG